MLPRIARHRSGLWLPADKPPYGSRLIPDHPLAQGLVVAWLFNETSGSTVFDYSGNGYHGTIVGGSYSLGAGDLFLNDNGNGTLNDTVKNTLIPDYDGLSASLVTCFALDATNTRSHIVNKFTADDGYGGFYLCADKVTAGQIHARDLSDSGWGYYGDVAAYSVGVFNQWAMVRNWPTGLTCYKDTAAYVMSGGGYNAASKNFFLGFELGASITWNNVYGFHGRFRYLYYYNRALSAAEISQIYADPYCMFEPVVPVRLWSVPAAAGFGLPLGHYYFNNMRS